MSQRNTVRAFAPHNQRFVQPGYNQQVRAAQTRANRNSYYKPMGYTNNPGHSQMTANWTQKAFGSRGGKTKKGRKSKRSRRTRRK